MATGTSQGQPYGTIQSVSGSAKIIGVDGSTRPVVAGGKIFNNEMILTNANASVKVQLGSSGQIVDIVGGSEYQVGVDAAPGAGGAGEGGGGTAQVTEQGAPGAGVSAGFLTEPIGGRVIGTVADTSGQATATSPDGSVRILGVGDKVFANETVTSSSGGPVNISLAGGGSLECGPGASLTLNPNLLSVGKPTGGIADIQAAILAGADPTQVTDPTAAGAPAAGGSEEGAGGSHVAVVIEQANSSFSPTAGFQTFGAGIGFPSFEFQLLQAGVVKPIASLLPLGPTVLEGTNGGSSHVIHFTIQLDKTVPVNVGVNFLITPPGADGNGTDLSSALVGTAVILAGTNSVVVDVAIVQDHFVEFNEPVSITLTEAINAVIDPAADTATITIVDDDVNPVAVDDTNWVQEDTAANASGNVLENHNHPGAPVGAFADVQDVDTDPIHVTTSGTVAGTYGSLVLNADGSYAYTLYTPEENAAAHAVVQALKANDAALIDSFTYTVSDGFNTPSSATLKISVFGTNDAPVLDPVDVTGTVYEAGLPTDTRAADPTLLHTGGTFHITDTDADDIKLATVQFRPSGDSEFIDFPLPEPSSSTTIDTGHGILTISSDDGGQTWNWTYDLYAPVPDGPGVDETDQFRVTVTDGTTEVTTDIFASIVLQDDVPQALNDTNAIAEDAASVSGNVLANDLSGGDTPKTLQSWGSEAANYGTLTKNADGSYVYALNNGLNAVQGLSVGETLTETFTYTMKDSDGDTSSATLTITITGTDDGVPIVGIGAEGGDQVVFENDLADGSSPNAAALTQSGSFTIEAKDGIAVLQVGDDVTGATLTVAQLLNSATYPVSVDTAAGVLVITGYSGNEFGGTVSYAYTLQDDVTHATGAGANNAFDNFAVSVTDEDGSEANQVLSVRIVDDLPQAVNDGPFNVTEDAVVTTVTGNAISNDNSFADDPASFVSWTSTTSTVLSQFGTLTLAPNGDYTFVLNNADADTQALNTGETRTETFQYTMQDADGDQSTATLTITITGTEDGVTITGIGAEGGDQTVFENDLADGSSPNAAALTQTGSFAITANDGIAEVKVGALTLTAGQLLNLSSANQTVDTAAGLLTLTGYTGNAQGGTVTYSYLLQDNVAHSAGGGTNNAFDNFAVSVTDEDGSSSSSTLSVRIVDDVPTSRSEQDSVQEDGPLTADGNVITSSGGSDANITDGVADTPGADGIASITWTGATAGQVAGSYGSLAVGSDGTYTYTLNNGVNGVDGLVQTLAQGETVSESFTYTITDGDGDTSTSTLTITITGTNDAPVDGNETGNVVEDGTQTASGVMLANAVDIDNGATLDVTLNSSTTGTYGSLTSFNSDTGAYTYTLNNGTNGVDGVVQTLAQGETVTDTFNYTVVDEFGATNTSTLTITITGTNDAPVDGNETGNVVEDGTQTASGNMLTNAVDIDNGATLDVTLNSSTTGTYGSLTSFNSDTGAYTYTLNNGTNGVDGVVQTLAQGETVTDTFNYTVVDEFGATNTSTLTITITGTNDAPVDADEGNSVTEGVTPIANGNVLANASDIDNNAELDATLISGTTGTYGSLTSFNTETGAYTYTLNGNVDLPEGQTVTDAFNYTVVDEFGATNTSTLTITIAGDNDAPVDANEGNSVTEDGTQTASGNVLANASDSDNDDLDATLISSTTGTYGSLTSFDSETGAYTYTLNNGVNGVDGVVQTLAQGETVTDTFNYTVVDEFGATNTSTLTITITGTNDAPVDGNETGNVVEDGTQTASGNMLTNAVDIDNGATLDVTLNSSTTGTYGSLTSFNSDTGAYTYTLNNGTNGVDGVVQTLAQGETVTDTFNYTVVDEFGATNTSTLTITITGTNDAPVDGNETGNVVEDGTQTASGVMLANATDIDNGATLDVTLNSSTTGTYGSLTSFNSDTGAYTYTLNNGTNGVDGVVQTLAQGETVTDTFNYTVVDEFGATNTSTLTITITGTNDAPVDGNETGNVVEDGTQTASGVMLANATDIDNGATLDVTLNSSTTGTYGSLTSFNSDTGAYTYTLNNGTNGVDGVVQTLAQGETVTDTFNYTVVDEFGATNTSTLTITITGTNDAPVDGNETGNVVEDGTQTASGVMLANAVDIDNGATLDVTLNSSTTGTYGSLTSFNSDTGAYTYTLNNGTNGVDGVVQTLAQGETVTDTFNYTVVDEFGATNTSTLTITITGTNDAPVDGNETGNVVEDGTQTASGNMLTNAVDIDNGATLDVTLNSSTTGTYGSLTSFNSDTGAYTYTLNNGTNGVDGVVQTLAQGETVTDTFNYTVVDEFGATNTSTLTITITGTNDAPVDGNETGNVVEDGTQTASGVMLANAVDIDNGATLDVTLNSSTTGTYGSLTSFNSDTGAYTYTLNNGTNGVDGVVQTLAQGETVTDTFNYTVVDEFGATNTSTLTITITGTNDAPVIVSSENWLPSDPAQQAPGYTNGYQLLITLPADIDNGTNLVVKATGTIPTGVFYFDGVNYVALTTNTVLYDPANSINFLDDVVYRPTANVTDTVNVTLTLDVFDGFVHLPQTVAIHELPPNRVPSETSTIGDGEHPLTSGQDQVANLVLTQGFINGIPDFHEATIRVFTDFQKAPFVLAIPLDERDPGLFGDSSAGSHREQEVQVELRIGAVRFAIVEDDLTALTFEQNWFFDAETGLMKATIDYDDIHLLDASGNATPTTLAQYLIANPPTAGTSWTLVYDDNAGGSYEARSVHFEFFSHDPGDPGILVSGSSTLPDQIYGTGGVDNLSGNGGNDVIFARADNDFVSGGDGNDTLSGGSGNDILNGGNGTDLFVWLNGNQGSVGAAAADTVQDFAAGDVLDLQDLLPDGPALSNYLDVTVSGSNVTIHVTNGTNNLPANDVQTIVLTGYTAESVGNILNELIANQTYVGKV